MMKDDYLNWKKDLQKINIDYSEGNIKELIDIASKYIKNTRIIKDEINDGAGYYLLKGLPLDDVIPEPPNAGVKIINTPIVTEGVLLGVTGLLGYYPFSYREEKNGAIVHNITPIKGLEGEKSSNGVVDFSFHTDAAYLNRQIRPETLSLICLVNDSLTGTNLISIDKIIQKLPDDVISILKSEQFIIKSPASFDIKKEVRTSILKEYEGKVEIQLSIEVTYPLSKAAEKSLHLLGELANELKETIMWEPGDMLIFNNRRMLHGRGKIKGKRWLQRCYGSSAVELGQIIRLSEY